MEATTHPISNDPVAKSAGTALRTHLEKFTELSDDEFAKILPFFCYERILRRTLYWYNPEKLYITLFGW